MIFSLVILFQYEDFIWWGWWGALSLAITLPMLIWAFSGIFFVNEKRISVSETLYIKDLMEVVIDVLEISFQLVKGAVWVLSQIIHGLWFLIRGFFSLIHHIFDAFD
jgi:hypothetical protein